MKNVRTLALALGITLAGAWIAPSPQSAGAGAPTYKCVAFCWVYVPIPYFGGYIRTYPVYQQYFSSASSESAAEAEYSNYFSCPAPDELSLSCYPQ